MPRGSDTDAAVNCPVNATTQTDCEPGVCGIEVLHEVGGLLVQRARQRVSAHAEQVPVSLHRLGRRGQSEVARAVRRAKVAARRRAAGAKAGQQRARPPRPPSARRLGALVLGSLTGPTAEVTSAPIVQPSAAASHARVRAQLGFDRCLERMPGSSVPVGPGTPAGPTSTHPTTRTSQKLMTRYISTASTVDAVNTPEGDQRNGDAPLHDAQPTRREREVWRPAGPLRRPAGGPSRECVALTARNIMAKQAQSNSQFADAPQTRC